MSRHHLSERAASGSPFRGLKGAARASSRALRASSDVMRCFAQYAPSTCSTGMSYLWIARPHLLVLFFRFPFLSAASRVLGLVSGRRESSLVFAPPRSVRLVGDVDLGRVKRTRRKASLIVASDRELLELHTPSLENERAAQDQKSTSARWPRRRRARV